jgi:competence transcription factor ComK
MKSSRDSTLLVMKLNTAHSSTKYECVWMCAAKSVKDFPDVFTHKTKLRVHSIASLHLEITISS